MALGLVLIGIVSGLLTGVSVLVLGGGLVSAFLAYVSGGVVGMLYGLLVALLPRHNVAVVPTQDRS